jgi:hypothetical protein
VGRAFEWKVNYEWFNEAIFTSSVGREVKMEIPVKIGTLCMDTN